MPHLPLRSHPYVRSSSVGWMQKWFRCFCQRRNVASRITCVVGRLRQCRMTPRMSVSRGRPEVNGAWSGRRRLPLNGRGAGFHTSRHSGFPSGRSIGSYMGTWVLSTTTLALLRRSRRSRHPYAAPRISLQCVCTRRRNRIEQLSTSPEYALGTVDLPPRAHTGMLTLAVTLETVKGQNAFRSSLTVNRVPVL